MVKQEQNKNIKNIEYMNNLRINDYKSWIKMIYCDVNNLVHCDNFINENKKSNLIMKQITNVGNLKIQNKNINEQKTYNINNNYNNRYQLSLTDNINKENLILLKNNLNFINTQTTKRYDEQELKGIQTIINKIYDNVINNKKNIYKFPLKNKDEFKYGRVYCNNSIMSIKSELRNMIIDNKTCYDLDIDNCHPSILSQLTKELDLPYLNYYITNRDDCLIQLMNKFNINRKKAKELPLIIINNGSINDKFLEVEWLNGLFNEMQIIYEYLSKTDIGVKSINHLINQCHQVNDRYYKNDTKKLLNLNGSMLNLILIKAEYDIINEVMNYLESNKIKIFTYCFDGLIIGKYNNENLLKDISEYVYSKIGLKVYFSFKEIINTMTDKLKNDIKNYNESINLLPSNIKTINELNEECYNCINLLNQPAGFGKTSKALNYILNDNRKCLSIVISPFIINQQSNIKKFAELNDDKYKLNKILSFDDVNLNEDCYDKDLINIIVQGDSHRSLNSLIMEIERQTFDYNTNYLNNNKTVIFTTIDSLKWVCYYLKKYNIEVNNLFVDEGFQVLSRTNLDIKNDHLDKGINSSFNPKTNLLMLINNSETIFISDIIGVKSSYELTNRKVNNIIFNAPKLYMSYDSIYLGNNMEIYNNKVNSGISLFIFSDKKRDCKLIYNDLINRGIDKNDIVLITADLDFNESFLKYKYIVSSPKIRGCISIMNDYFPDREAIGFNLGNHINNYDFINALQRVRACKNISILVDSPNNKKKEFYNNNQWISNDDKKIMNIITDYNNLDLKTMINSLIKNDGFQLIEDFDDSRGKLKFEKSEIFVDDIELLKESEEIITKRILFNKKDVDDNYNFNITRLPIQQDENINKIIELYNNNLINKEDCLNNIADFKLNLTYFNEIIYFDNDYITREEFNNKFNDEFQYEKEYLTNSNKINVGKIEFIKLRDKQIINNYNKTLNKIKTKLDKENICYNNYIFEDNKNYGLISNNKIVNINTNQFIRAKRIINNIKNHYNEIDEYKKFEFLTQVINKDFKQESNKNHPYIKMYKIKENDIDLTKKLINIAKITKNKEEITNKTNYFNLDEYINSLKDCDELKTKLNNRKDKNIISQKLLRLIKKQVKNVDFDNLINYEQIKNSNHECSLKKVDINLFEFSVIEHEFKN